MRGERIPITGSVLSGLPVLLAVFFTATLGFLTKSVLAEDARSDVSVSSPPGPATSDSKIPDPKRFFCHSDTQWLDGFSESVGTGWGVDAENSRFVPVQGARLSVKDLPRLKLKWVFNDGASGTLRSQPAVAGRAIFFGSAAGIVYALDSKSGCLHWMFRAEGGVQTSVVFRASLSGRSRGSVGHPMVFFGDLLANVYAVDALNGSLQWKVKVDDHPAARVVGTPALVDERIYVPVSSMREENAAAAPDYQCCTFRGSLVALERSSGKMVWKRYTIPKPAVEQYRNSTGKPDLGPSGAGVWVSPAFDRRRNALYIATGNNYSDPSDDNSDAIFSIDAADGHIRWKRQMMKNDSFNAGCMGEPVPTCPRKPGLDADFTAAPVLVHGKGGRDILLAGQKSGDAFGLDPDSGAVVWHNRISKDARPLSGGIWYGMTVANGQLIIPMISVRTMNAPPTSEEELFFTSPVNGLHALDVLTGRLLWSASVSSYCESGAECAGTLMAPMSIAGATFAASREGTVRAFDTQSGRVLWRFNTARNFVAVNGEPVAGGAILGAGPLMIGQGTLYVASGPALFAFSRQ